MNTFKLIGCILPPNKYSISGVDLPSVEYKIPTIDETIKCHFQIEQSKITVTCEVAEYKKENLRFYVNYVTDFTRAILHLISFSLADALDVFFDEVEANGAKLKLLRADPRLQKLCTAFKPDNNKFSAAMRIVMKEPNLFLALSDVISVLRDGTVDVSACYRAIERLRNILSPDESKQSKEPLRKLRDTLKLSKEFIEYIAKNTNGYRHGKLKPLTPEIRSEILRRTWIILNGFIEYRMEKDKDKKR